MTSKVCRCGKKFETNRSQKIHCSIKCANKYNPSRIYCDKHRDYKYQARYGITIEDYNELFNLQNGCCAVCDKHQSEFKRKLAVDHNHETGKVRGLLCHKCNRALGLFRDNPEILNKATEYVS